MDLHVESRPGLQGDLEPTAFELGGKLIKVVQIIDRWIASDHSYFKIEAEDSGIYILRFTPEEKHWELTLFQAKVGLDFTGMPKRNAIQFQ
jgi:hypothetical protein